MRKMEEEMSKFRTELMNRESKFFGQSMVTSSRYEHETWNRLTYYDPILYPSRSVIVYHDPPRDTWLESIASPLIQTEGDQKQLKLRFDVSQYKPEEIVVKTVDNKLLVHAKHEEKSSSRSVYREYNREFLLPKGTDPESIKSSLSRDGVLTVEAPLPVLLEGTKRIPIAYM